MTDNVVPIGAHVVLPPELVIDNAKKADLQTVVIIGFDKDGCEYFDASVQGGGTVLWLLERAKLKLLRTVDHDG